MLLALNINTSGYKAITISTIVDEIRRLLSYCSGYKAITISTIVDFLMTKVGSKVAIKP